MTKKLALYGGNPIRKNLFPAYNTIGQEEKSAVLRVLDSGCLSQFLGAWHKDFFGGPTVQAFEKAWAKHFNVKHAITVNSNTSGLIASMGACGVGPGDEVIVSPYTMSASAIAPAMYGAVPVFADIDENTYCLDPKSIEEKITPRTKAILVVHIFGLPADMDEILAIAKKHGIKVIEDTAQAPLAEYKGTFAGTMGDIGVYSLNYHKHIHTGEGGVIVTNDDFLAEKLQLIRNHGEQVVEPKGTKDIWNTLGYNFRMTEIEAAIGIEQLKKLPALIKERQIHAKFFEKELGALPGITPSKSFDDRTHAYYLQAFKFQESQFGVHRDLFIKAVKAEIPSAILREDTPLIGAGYMRPLYMQPFYQKRASHCSFNCPRYEGTVDYSANSCPTTERMYFNELFTHEYMRPGMTDDDRKDVVRAFHKVIENINELQNANA